MNRRLQTLWYLCFAFFYQIGWYHEVHFHSMVAFAFRGAQTALESELRRGHPSGWRLLCLCIHKAWEAASALAPCGGPTLCGVGEYLSLEMEICWPHHQQFQILRNVPLDLMSSLHITVCHFLIEFDWIMKY